MDFRVERVRRGRLHNRIEARPGDDRVDLIVGEQLAELRSAQVSGNRTVGDVETDLAPVVLGGLETQRADQAQVNVDHVLDVGRVEVDEQVLAVGGGAGET